MKTVLYSPTPQAMEECGALLRQGELVCFPTETVYGLGANAMDPNAVADIFKVKNRPANNPLIAHICDLTMLGDLAEEVPAEIKELVDQFWPGPLTVIFRRRPAIPAVISAGLSTVAVRWPEHPVAQELIRAAGVPVVAPSANLSGRPSPTCLAHCKEDLEGKIAAIIDGGSCSIGLESTVVLPLGGRKLKLLRPGGITPEMLEAVGYSVEIDPAVLAPVQEGAEVSSPGMLYKHYAPIAPLTIVTGEPEAVTAAIRQKEQDGVWVLAFDEYKDCFRQTVSFGSIKDPASQSRALFDALRQFDTLPCQKIYAMYPNGDGVGLAIRNRLLRAAGFQIIPAERL